jgi:phenylalanyl-tRNA synthetase beta chain
VTVVGVAPAPSPIEIDSDLPARISGVEIPAATTVALLRAVGCSVIVDGDRLTATPPPWRPDLTDPYDLVEEVVRIVGYDRVPSILPRRATGRGLTREQRLRRRVGRVLAGAGAAEVISFPFVGDAAWDALGLPADDPRRSTVRLANPLSAEAPAYTTTVLPGLLEAAGRNLGRGAPGVTLFETQAVAMPADNGPAPIYGVDRRPTEQELDALLAAIPVQWTELGLVLAGEQERGGWWGPARTASWEDALALVDRLAGDLSVEISVESASVMPWHPGRCAKVSAGESTLGFAGELHPKVCRAYGLPERSAAVVLDLDALMAAAPDVVSGPEFSTFPVAKEDVALVVDEAVPAGAVEAALREGAGDLLESVRLFDVYVGEQIGEGKKSLAFALRFRAPDRTLVEGEAGAARDAAVARAAERTGAVQRV